MIKQSYVTHRKDSNNPGQSGLESNGVEGLLHILQN